MQQQDCHITDDPCAMNTLPGEVGVVLVDQIFLDPEIIVACWEEHNLLVRGVVTIPEARCDRIPQIIRPDILKQAGIIPGHNTELIA